MRTLTLPHYLAVGLAASLAAGALYHFAAPGLGTLRSLALLMHAIGAIALGTEWFSRRRRTGRAPFATLLALLWLATTLTVATLLPGPLTALLVQTALYALARGLWRGRSPVGLLFEAGVAVLAVATVTWVLAGTGSPWLAAWTWFLAHGVSLLLPARADSGPEPGPDDRFELARRSSLAALDRISPHL